MNILRPTPIDPYPRNNFFQHIEDEFEKLYARSPLPKILENQLNSSSDSAVFKSPPKKNVSKDVSQSQKAKIFLSLKNHNNSDSNQSYLSDNSFSLHREKIRQPSNHGNVLQGNSYRELSVTGENDFNYMENDNQRVSHSINRSFLKSREYSNPYEDGRSSVSEIDNSNVIEQERRNFIDRNNSNFQERTRSPAKVFLAMKNSSNKCFRKSDTFQNKENEPAILNHVNESYPIKVNNHNDNSAHEHCENADMEIPHGDVYRKYQNVNTELEAENDNGGEDDDESAVEENVQDFGNGATGCDPRKSENYDGDEDDDESMVEESVQDFDNGATGYDASMESDDDENDGGDNDADVEDFKTETYSKSTDENERQTDDSHDLKLNNQTEEIIASDKNKKSYNKSLKMNPTNIDGGTKLGQMNGNQKEIKSQGQRKKERKSCKVHVKKLTNREADLLTETKQPEVFSQEVDRVRKSRKAQESEINNTIDLFNDSKHRKAKQNLYTWIIRKHEFSDGICVEGKKRINDVDVHCSDVVTKRLSPKFIETSCGAIYCLIGNIKAANCLKAGFSKEIVKAFKKGFPENWKELIEDEGENNDRTKSSNKSKAHLQDVSEREIKKAIKGHSKSGHKERASNKSKSTKHQEEETEAEPEELSDKRSKEAEPTNPTNLHLWIIKRISHLEGICVEGKKSLKDDYFWHSGIVTKRISPKIVETSSGSRYQLIGDIETLDCLDAGFSKDVIKHFKKGFPVNWRELIEKPRQPTKRTSDGIKTPVKQSKKDEDDTAVYTPTGQVVQLDSLKKTRSGRVVKPQLAWWRGENFKMDPTNSILEVSYGSKHAEEFHKELAEQYKRSSKRFVGYKRIGKANTSQNIVNKSQNTSSTKKNKSLGQDSIDNTIDLMTDLRSSVNKPEDNSQSPDVQNVLNASKQNRTKNKNGLRKSSVSKAHKVQVTKTKKIHNSNISKDGSNSKSVRKNTVREMKKKNNDLDEEDVSYDEDNDDSDGDEDYVPNTVKNAKKVTSGTAKKKNKTLGQDSIDNTTDHMADLSNTLKKAKKVNSGTVKKNPVLGKNDKKTKVNDSNNEEAPWQKQEIKLLQRAVCQVKKDAPQFWHKVADIVKTRSVEECQKFYYVDIETKPRKGTENKNKGQEPVKLTAKPGTLKRKQQVRDLLDQYNDDYEDDLFDSTPFRTKGKIKIPKIVDESIFDELARANPDIVNNLKTPTTKLYIEAVSEKKTPASSLVISPFPTIDRKDADRFIRNMQIKRRQLAHHNKTKKFSTQTPVTRTEVQSKVTVPAPISNLFDSSSLSTKNLFCQEDSSGDNHDNSDEENDYYWSETEEA